MFGYSVNDLLDDRPVKFSEDELENVASVKLPDESLEIWQPVGTSFPSLLELRDIRPCLLSCPHSPVFQTPTLEHLWSGKEFDDVSPASI